MKYVSRLIEHRLKGIEKEIALHKHEINHAKETLRYHKQSIEGLQKEKEELENNLHTPR